MKFSTLIVLLLVGILAFSLVGCAPEEDPAVEEEPKEDPQPDEEPAEEVTLRFANYFPGESGPGLIGEEFAEEVEARTDGRVEIDYYPGGMLLGPGEMYDGVVEGVADMGFSNLGYTFGRFRESEILDLPIGFPNAWVANHVKAEFYEEFEPEEFDDVHVLTFHSSPINTIITEDILVETPGDVEGVTLRGTGWVAATVEALGATAEDVGMPDAYDYLERGMMEGLLIPYETVDTFGYGEVTNHATEIWQLGQSYSFYIVVNQDSWNAISAEDQEIITEYVEGEFRDELAQMWNRIDIEGKEFALERDYTITEIPDEELNTWQDRADMVIDDYVELMLDEGYTEEELEERFDFIEERIDYWLERQAEEGIESSTGPEEVQIDW